MEAEVLNFKRYESGSMVGFFDLAVAGLVVTGCKAFRKGDDKLWFAWPSTKGTAKDGADVWNDIVTASEPVMRHLQGLVRPQIRALILGNAGGNQARQPANGGNRQSGEHGDRAYQESRLVAAAADDIPF